MELITSTSSSIELNQLLHKKGWLGDNEEVTSVTVPGEGNMNVVLRVVTNLRSLIVKQSRPYVQKYPSVPAPLDRIKTEYQFYDALRESKAASKMPKVIAYDNEDYLLLMEDLGDVDDLTVIYSGHKMQAGAIELLVNVLMEIHQAKIPADFPSNIELRQLNHQHIFVLPFLVDNGFELDDIQLGLQKLSLSYKEDERLKTTISEIGNKYLSSGDTMLHGDFYPGSWMGIDDAVYVLDPEFSFAGFAEFDLGVMIGHLIIANVDESISNTVLDYYSLEYDATLVRQMAGIEIMRRLIGLAQLPLDRTISQKKLLLEVAYNMIMA